ncbi:MAG TPA: BrnA antitoxin family protein [Roseiarcus sp.]
MADKDGEIRELTAEDMRLFRPIGEVDADMVEAMEEFRRKLGRPKAEAPKVHIGFRLASDVVASIKASGRGYNARVEQALRAAGFGDKIKRASSKVTSAAKKRGSVKQTTKPAVSKRRA